jgi:opacity protein-like surface antigen
MSRKSVSRKLLLASAAALALTAPALAADLPQPLPPPPVFTWTGIYLGGQIGYGWGDNTGNVAFATPGGIVGTNALGGDAKGVIGGGHVGYNLQINQWVIGLEGAVDGTTLSRNVLIAAPDNTGAIDPNTGLPFPGGTVTGTVRSGIQGSIRGRVGIAWDRLLIYGTGGVAFGGFTTELQLSGTDAAGPFFASGSRSSTRVGWTAGGGVEYAINAHWSVRADYRYSDFGRIRDLPAATVAGLSLSANRHLAQNQVQVGFSYKFDSFAPVPVIAKY